MNAAFQAIWNTINLIASIAFWGAQDTYDRIRPRAQVYLVALTAVTVGSLFVVFILSVIEMVTDWSLFGYLAAFIAVTMTLALGLLWSPLTVLVGMIIDPAARNPLESGRRYMRRLSIALFAELMLALYALFVPTHNAIVAIPALIIAGSAFAIGVNLWGGGISPKILVRFALIAVVAITLGFFFPDVPQALGNAVRGVNRTLADVLNGNVQLPIAQQTQASASGPSVTVTLRGSGQASQEVDLDQWAQRYPGYNYTFEGPRGTEVQYLRGPRGSIANDYGVRGGRIVFYGQAGETATVRFHQ